MTQKPPIRNNFRKAERLCSHKALAELYEEGEAFLVYPIRCVYRKVEFVDEPLRVLISVPKRNHRRAVHRNLLKRRIREAYRLNRQILLNKIWANSMRNDEVCANLISNKGFSNPILCKSYADPVLDKGYSDPTLDKDCADSILGEGYADPTLDKDCADPILGEGYSDPTLDKDCANSILSKGYSDPMLGEGYSSDPMLARNQIKPTFSNETSTSTSTCEFPKSTNNAASSKIAIEFSLSYIAKDIVDYQTIENAVKKILAELGNRNTVATD